MGPHPAVAEIRRVVRKVLRTRSQPRAAVYVACSGGADSLALAAATAFEARRVDVPYGLVSIDHGLHDRSAAQAARVASLGFELGFDPVQVLPVVVGRQGGPEAAARSARYDALRTLDTDVLLGHTLDDQAETVLLGLGRGSGPRSIAGMSEIDGRWLRPLLGVRRATTRAACAALGLVPWEDPANDDDRYQRVRLRHEVLPLLEDVLQGGVAEALARTASLVQADLTALDELAAAHTPLGAGLEVKLVAELPEALLIRVLRAWVSGAGGPALTSERTRALAALVTDWRGQDRIELTGGYAVRRRSGTLEIEAEPVEGNSDRRRRAEE